MNLSRRLTRPSLALAALAALPACAAFTSMHGPAAGSPAARGPAVEGTALRDWKGVVHCHSYLSHDSRGTVEEIGAAAAAAGLDFLVMTDHQTDRSIRDGVRGVRDGVLWIVGAELRSNRGTVLAFPLQQPLRRVFDVRALVAEAAAQGALVFFAHCEQPHAWDTPGVAGFEIVNLHAGALAASVPSLLVAGVFFPVRTLLGLCCRRDAAVFARWDEQLAARPVSTPVGGVDAHANVRLFGPLGGTLGAYHELFLQLSTHVLAERCDEPALVDALRAGRTFVVFDRLRDGTGFDFRAVGAGPPALAGATVPAAAALRLRVHAPAAAEVRLLRDGVVAAVADGRDLELAAPTPGVWRAEVWLGGDPWIFSGAIRVAAAP